MFTVDVKQQHNNNNNLKEATYLFCLTSCYHLFSSAGYADAQTYTCGSLLQDTSGSFSSPDDDGDGLYDSNQLCRWTIVAEEHKMIQLQVIELDIEEQGDQESCYNDYLAVRFTEIINIY